MRIKKETTPFPKLKSLNLHRTNLDTGSLCASSSLTDLEIMIDEHQSLEETFYRDPEREYRFDYFYKQITHFQNSSFMMSLLEQFPALSNFRLGWSRRHNVEFCPIYDCNCGLWHLEQFILWPTNEKERKNFNHRMILLVN